MHLGEDETSAHWYSDTFIRWMDSRIDNKVDKLKLWLFAGILVNLVPVLAFAYMFGQFTGRIENQLTGLNDAAPNRYTQAEQEIYSREVDRRITRLEGAHGLETGN